MEYQEARVQAFQKRIEQLEKQVLDLNFILTIQEQELCEKKSLIEQLQSSLLS